MPVFRYTRPTRRAVLALIVFIVLIYSLNQFQGLVLPGLLDFVKNTLHLSTRSVFGQRPSIPVNLLTTSVLFRSVCVLLITWVALRIERRPWRDAGYARANAVRNFGLGLLTGFIAISVLMGMMWFSGVLIFDGQRLHGFDIVNYGLRWLFGMLLVGLTEECFFRGYALISFARIFSVLPAILLTSLAFVAGHRNNPGENFLGLLQVFVFAAICALSVFRTGSVWWAVAFHGAWDWAQGSFYGTLGSGYWFDGHIFQFRPQGSPLLSGSTDGPEGSVYVFVVLGVLLCYELAWRYRNPQGSSLELRAFG